MESLKVFLTETLPLILVGLTISAVGAYLIFLVGSSLLLWWGFQPGI